MKRIIFLLFTFVTLLPLNAFGWGRLGHYTAAEIAERHLTPEAKRNIERYTNGTPLAEYAVWMDVVAKTEPYKHLLRGWHATIADTRCKSPKKVRDEYRDGRDGISAMEYFTEELRNRERLSDSVVLTAIKCIVHIIPDFHCPAHVRFTDYKNSGDFKVMFYGKSTKFHKIWDSGVISRGRGIKDHKKYADMLDTYSKREIARATKGGPQQWFEDAARKVRPTMYSVKAGDTLDEKWVKEVLPFGEQLVTESGYRLAKALNTLFGNEKPKKSK